MQGVGCRVYGGAGCRMQGVGCRVWGEKCRVEGLRWRVGPEAGPFSTRWERSCRQRSEIHVWGLGFSDQGLGFGGLGVWFRVQGV